jgi:hypothetical protein
MSESLVAFSLRRQSAARAGIGACGLAPVFVLSQLNVSGIRSRQAMRRERKMGKGEIRKLNSESGESFVEAPRARRERPICQWVRDAEEGQLVARWIFESEIKAASQETDYPHAA